MDKIEAKMILAAYREDLELSEDSAMKEALQMAENDADLRTFLNEERAFDLAFSRKLKELAPPPSLLDRILQNTPREEVAEIEAPSFQHPNVVWWRKPMVWSMAACLIAVLALGVVLFRTGSPASASPETANLNAFAEMAAIHFGSEMNEMNKMDYADNDLSALKKYLAKSHSPSPRNLPDGMKNLTGLGCLSLAWEDVKVGVICFKGEKLYNLYIANRKGFPNLKDYGEPDFKKVNDYTTAAWTTENQVYVLTVKGEKEDLNPLL